MFSVVCTGVNENYGKKGKKRQLGNSFMMYALKNGYIEPNNFKYIGNLKTNTSPRIKEHEKLMPIKWINAEKTLEAIDKRILRVAKELQAVNNITASLRELMKKK